MHTSHLLAIQLIPDFIVGAAVVIIGHWVWLFGFQGKQSRAATASSSKKGYQTGSAATVAESSHFVTRPDLPALGIPGYGASANNGLSSGPPTLSPSAGDPPVDNPSSKSVSYPEPPIVPRVINPPVQVSEEVAIDAYQKHFEDSERLLREKEGLTPPTGATHTLLNQPNGKQVTLLPTNPTLEELPLHQALLFLQAGTLAPSALSQLERLASLTSEAEKGLSYPMEPSQPQQLELADYLNAFPCLAN